MHRIGHPLNCGPEANIKILFLHSKSHKSGIFTKPKEGGKEGRKEGRKEEEESEPYLPSSAQASIAVHKHRLPHSQL
jgi:hypothetical protein